MVTTAARAALELTKKICTKLPVKGESPISAGGRWHAVTNGDIQKTTRSHWRVTWSVPRGWFPKKHQSSSLVLQQRCRRVISATSTHSLTGVTPLVSATQVFKRGAAGSVLGCALPSRRKHRSTTQIDPSGRLDEQGPNQLQSSGHLTRFRKSSTATSSTSQVRSIKLGSRPQTGSTTASVGGARRGTRNS